MTMRHSKVEGTGKARIILGSVLLATLAGGPLVAQQSDVPPPGPYAAPGMPGQGFNQPWGQQAPVMGMSREEFQKQQAERRAAMEKHRAEMRSQRGAMMPPPQWPAAADADKDHEKRMAEMRERHQQQMAKYREQAPAMNHEDHKKRFEEMKARHEARMKEIQSQEKEMQKLWEDLQARQKTMLENIEKMRAEREAYLTKMYGDRPAPVRPPVVQQPQQPQQPPAVAPGYYRPMPYWQGPMPYGPRR